MFTAKGVLGERVTYKPFSYEWQHQAFLLQQKAHWLPDEIPMGQDVSDFRHKLNEPEKHLVTQILKFFTQADVDVAGNYLDRLIPCFRLPETRMMLTAFSAMEAIHMHAYAFLSDSLNIDSKSFYSEFLEIAEMAEKHEFLESVPKFRGSVKTEQQLADLVFVLATYGGFVEGLQLFSSFVILNNFDRRNLLKGVGQIVTWSMRDESLHCESVLRLMRTVVNENQDVWTDAMKSRIIESCVKVVDLEDRFIDVCYEAGEVNGLKSSDVKQYIRYVADNRLEMMSLKPIYNIKNDPVPWLHEKISANEMTNFFENQSTSYGKALVKDDWR